MTKAERSAIEAWLKQVSDAHCLRCAPNLSKGVRYTRMLADENRRMREWATVLKAELFRYIDHHPPGLRGYVCRLCGRISPDLPGRHNPTCPLASPEYRELFGEEAPDA